MYLVVTNKLNESYCSVAVGRLSWRKHLHNASVTSSQKIEKYIDMGNLYCGSCGPQLATQSDHGKEVKYGHSGPMYVCSRHLDGDKYIHSTSIL
jgi:hypothetical protein